MDNRTKLPMNALIKSHNWVQKLLWIRMKIFTVSSSVPCDFDEKLRFLDH